MAWRRGRAPRPRARRRRLRAGRESLLALELDHRARGLGLRAGALGRELDLQRDLERLRALDRLAPGRGQLERHRARALGGKTALARPEYDGLLLDLGREPQLRRPGLGGGERQGDALELGELVQLDGTQLRGG